MNGTTGIVVDDRYLAHDTGPGHPERSDRLRSIRARLDDDGLLASTQAVPASPVDLKWVERVHTRGYVAKLREACERKVPFIDTPDSRICPESYDIARLAAGGVRAAVDAVMEGRIRNAFCAVRPPGHHAERELSMGFCLFNNIAIAARYLQARWDLKRVLILAWAVHHGNGTQHTFDDDPTVFFCSMHEHPAHLYPGTGYPHEKGTGPGEGSTLNVAMMPGADDADYRPPFEETFVPAAQAFKPQFVLVSAGFDAHKDDPLAHIELTDAGFEWLTQQSLAVARECCEGRLVSMLEGGYDLDALSACASMHVQLLSQDAGRGR